MQFVTLEDETGLVEAISFPDAFKARGQPFTVGEVVPAAGVVELQDGVEILRLSRTPASKAGEGVA